MNHPQIGPDPRRIKKRTEMQPPATKKGVRSFLGLVNQLCKLCIYNAMATSRIRSLLHNKAKFCWTDEHQDELTRLSKTSPNMNTFSHTNRVKKCLHQQILQCLALGSFNSRVIVMGRLVSFKWVLVV